MVEIWLPYGSTEVFTSIPDEQLIGIVKSDVNIGARIIDKEKIISKAFEIKNKSFENAIEGKKTVAIVIGRDYSLESVSNIFKRLMDKIKSCGIPEKKITLFTSTDVGGNTLQSLLSGLTQYEVKIIPHNLSGEFIKIPAIKDSLEISLNRRFVEADFKIAIGAVTPHPLFCFDGTPFKVIPGLADQKTSRKTFTEMRNSHRNFKDDRILPFKSIFDNLPLDFTINIIPDQRGGILDITAGPLWESYHNAVERYKEQYRIQIKTKPDVLVGSVGGTPFDDDLLGIYQSTRTAIDILKEGGPLILAAEWRKWHDSIDLLERISRLKDEPKPRISKLYDAQSIICYMFPEILEKTDVTLVSTIPHHYSRRVLKLKAARTVNSALKNLRFQMRDKDKILVATNLYQAIPVVN